jgi:hypothetical protein
VTELDPDAIDKFRAKGLTGRAPDLRVSKTGHGPAHWRRDHSPTWILRGLEEFNLEFRPTG